MLTVADAEGLRGLPPARARRPAKQAVKGALSLDDVLAGRRRGRGAVSNRSGRFESETRETEIGDEESRPDARSFVTQVTIEKPRTIITRNDSPDISFDRSINPYRGCEHGCVYCFARPTHAFMGLSSGLDFETKLFVKEGAAEKLERELAVASYKPRTIAIGTNTDPYQPIEPGASRDAVHPRSPGPGQPSCRHRDQIGLGHARHRHLGTHGGERAGEGRVVGNDARSQARPEHGTARRDPRRNGSTRSGACPKRAFR